MQTHTCNLPHSVEDFQFLWIEGWYAIVCITLNRKKETKTKLKAQKEILINLLKTAEISDDYKN